MPVFDIAARSHPRDSQETGRVGVAAASHLEHGDVVGQALRGVLEEHALFESRAQRAKVAVLEHQLHLHDVGGGFGGVLVIESALRLTPLHRLMTTKTHLKANELPRDPSGAHGRLSLSRGLRQAIEAGIPGAAGERNNR